MKWNRRHVLDTDDWSRDEIETVLDQTRAMIEILQRPIRRAPPLRGRTVTLFFAESSTRTRVPFELAAKALSADVTNITASGSSVEKGESLYDTVRTLQALGGDVVVMRHASSGAPYFVAQRTDAAVINAGDGWHAHPTQGLLDAYIQSVKQKRQKLREKRKPNKNVNSSHPNGQQNDENEDCDEVEGGEDEFEEDDNDDGFDYIEDQLLQN